MNIEDITKPPITVTASASMAEALDRMNTEQTNTLLVVDDAGVLIGEVTVTDILDAIVPEYLDGDSIAAHFATQEMFEDAITDARDQQVKDFMATNIQTVETDDSLMAVASLAISQQRGRIAVVDDAKKPIGIISRRGLKKIITEFLGTQTRDT